MSRERASGAVWERLRSEALQAPALSADDEYALIEAAQAGDGRAMRTLCVSHLRLVVQIAASYRRSWVRDDDLVSEGAVGLVEAVQRFDLSQPTRLSTYAAWWIRARIRQFEFESRSLLKLPATRGVRVARAQLANARRQLGQELGREATLSELAALLNVSEAEVACVASSYSARDAGRGRQGAEVQLDPPDPLPGPEERVAEHEAQAFLSAQLDSARASMRERDRLIFDAHLGGSNMVELASGLGVTRQRVCQIVHRLRDSLESDLRAAVG